MSFVNPNNVYETVEHPKGFEYNFIIESGDGIKYYTEMTTTTSFRLKAVSDRYGNTALYDPANGAKYTLDSAGRKIKISSPFDGAETALKKTYYDSNGNVIKEMTKKNAAGEADRFKTMQYTYDSMNRLTCTDNGLADSFYSARYTRYEYNSKGNMIHVLKSLKDNSITYAYNGDNLRQSKTTNGVTTSHVYDGSDIVYEKKGSDTYNFDEYREGTSISNYLNNFGYDLQKNGDITPYSWSVTFVKKGL